MVQVDNGFILPLEKETFIEQLKDIVDKAEDMLNEDTEGERSSALTCGSQEGQASEGQLGEVRSTLRKWTPCNDEMHSCTEPSLTTLQNHQCGAPQHVYQQNGKSAF